MALTKNQIEHREYLQTPQWKALRARVLDRDNHICQRCKKKKASQVHHLTYKNWKNEKMEDLQSLCGGCHHKIHFKADGSRRSENKNNKRNRRRKNPFKQSSNNSVKLPKRMRKIAKYIKNLRKLPENFISLSRAGRALLLPHPIEILDWFGFQGDNYHQKLADMKVKKFEKEELIQKLLTLDIPYRQYLNRKESSG